MNKIVIKDAYENNLKHLDVEIPLNKFTCVTGCSGCGKSSLVFDTIYAESQRAFLEGMSGNVYSQKLMDKPKVGAIENLHPALNISQNYFNVNPRSTIGTTTEISYYLRSLFALINSNSSLNVTENLFSSNNPQSFCPNCSGLGVETIVSESLLIPDRNVTLRDGGILLFKGSLESMEQKFLEALCEYYGIDINKKISQLSKTEIHQLLYANDNIRYKITYKDGKRRKQHYVILRGAIHIILDRTANNSSIYSKYMEETPCHVCNGTKLRKEILKYKVGNMNYGEVENMELTSLYSWIEKFSDNRIQASKLDLIAQLKDIMLCKLQTLLQLDVGYLCLNRPIPTLSGGERQRVRIATQLTCSLKGLIYILDEPCKGLHYRDITKIINATRNLVHRENTVIAIEHNKKYILSADHVLELGPEGGPNGGYLMKETNNPSIQETRLLFKEPKKFQDYFQIMDINFRNIHNQTARFPIGGITCITGVSGSGKSTLANVVARCFTRKGDNLHGTLYGGNDIKRAIQVTQAPIGKTPRSTIVSYLDIYDEIRTLFSETASAKQMKFSSSIFSMNVKGGRCETCQGTGLQKIEFNFLPDSFIVCPECGGKRFNEQVLSIKYRGKTINDILEEPISEIISVFNGNKKINSTLKCMMALGLGYLKLGQMSMNLSGGEAQRIKLAKALSSSSSHNKNIYILDEPTSGLNDVDIDRFINVIFSLQQNHETIIIVEHNVEFIARVADYIIDFGIYGGNSGGQIVAQGDPQSVFFNKVSSLYKLDKIG